MSVTLRSVSYSGNDVIKTVTENQHAGLVLAKFHQTTRVMSDIWEDLPYALVWNVKENRADKIHIESLNDAVVDATSEVLEAYRSWVVTNYINSYKVKILDKQSIPKIGSMVKVVSGRNSKGTIGKVTYIKDMPYQMGYRTHLIPKLCIALSDDKVTMTGRYGRTYDKYTNVAWVWARNCKVLNSEIISDEDLQQIKSDAEKHADTVFLNLKKTYFPEFSSFR
jgi:hypothetical protein